MRWAEIPAGFVRAYAAMLPRLRDQESLRMVAVIAAGAGAMTDETRAEFIGSLTALQPQPQPVAGPRRQRSSLADIAAAGIPVHGVTL